MKKVQIFIPTFNRCEKLKNAIISCLNQTYGNIECIILDNHSDDNTEQMSRILLENDPRIRYVKNSHNLGMIGNFNNIRNLISADFFCVLTDDDTYEPFFVSHAISLFKKFPIAEVSISNAPTRSNGNIVDSQISEWEEGFYHAGQALDYSLRGRHPILTHCVFRKSCCDFFFFENDLAGSADILFFAKLLSEKSVVVSKKITGFYDLHGENITIKSSGVERINQKYNLYKKLSKLFELNENIKLSYFKFSIAEIIKLLVIYDSYININKNIEILNLQLGGGVAYRLIIRLLRYKYIHRFLYKLLMSIKKIRDFLWGMKS